MAEQVATSTDPLAVPALFGTTGPALVRNGDDWTLDFGDVQAGQILSSVRFGVQNAARAPDAHSLSVTSEQFGDAAFRVFGAPIYDDIGPGTGRGETVITVDTAFPGDHTQTIVLHPVDVAADGTRTPLPDQTARVSMSAVGDLGGAGAIPFDAFSASLEDAGRDQYLATTPVLLDGEHFARIANLGSWSTGGDLSFAPSAEQAASYGPDYLFATFQQVRADLSGAGAGVRQALVVGGKGGALDTGAGGQAVAWSFASEGAGDGNTAAIDTGAGNDSILVTAVGLDGLDDRLAPGSVLPYAIYPGSVPRGGSTYEGAFSSAVVRPGQGEDAITIQGEAAVTVLLGQGDGDDTVSGFVSGASRIQISGVDPAATSVAAAIQGGKAGTLLTYGAAGDSVFLPGVGALNDGDVAYVDVPRPGPGGGGTPPTPAAPAFASFAQAVAARFYDTMFDRKPEAGGLDFWTRALQDGTPLRAVADGFMQSPEWQARYGVPDSLAFVETLYRNVLDRAGEAEGVAFWTAHLDTGAARRGEVVVAFSESAEHVAKVTAVDFLP
ncbi:hypothetical protein GCM10009416_51270 [Craurococcus roseus]|uniref:DUF4214 domain-containing protein n=1 Tax=Craurococcus roseus TaxID=77585 RepID=A0ABN1GC03_9PROT